MRPVIVAAASLMLFASIASAQCPDGTPPPCGADRRATPARSSAPPPAPQRARRFLLLPFRNVTRAPAQDWLVTGGPLMLAASLGQFRDLQVVPEEKLTAALRRASLPTDVAPDATQLRRIAEETGGWTAVTGTVMVTGGRLRVAVQALDIATTTVLTRAEGEIAIEGDVRLTFDTLAARLLAVTGVSANGAVELGALTTTSVDAYRQYVAGVDAMRRADGREAIDAFAAAVRIDSTFALAWARLGLATVLWESGALGNATGPAYRAMERATRMAQRLPPRDERQVRAMQSAFLGRMAVARLILDSAVVTDPSDLEAREFLALTELYDRVVVDTTANPLRLRGSWNRAARLLEEVLARDPARRSAYSWMAQLYGDVAGVSAGQPAVGALKREGASLSSLANPMANVVTLIPVIRDSIEFQTDRVWGVLPRAERRRLQERAIELGRGWTDRWVSASPDDPLAHWWLALFSALAGDHTRALRELDLADNAKFTVAPYDVAVIRARSLLATGRYVEAAKLSDSARMAPNRAPSWFESQARVGIAARLLTGKWEAAWRLADSSATRVRWPASRCLYLGNLLAYDFHWAIPMSVRVAVMDTLVAHFAEVERLQELGSCVVGLAGGLAADSVGLSRPRAAEQVVKLVESRQAMPGAEGDAAIIRAGWLLRSIDTVAAQRLVGFPRYVNLLSDLSVQRRFEPAGFVVAGDSVTVSWRWIGTSPARWDVPNTQAGWGLRARTMVVEGRDTTVALFFVDHPWNDPTAEVRGGVAELAAAATQKGARVNRGLPGMRLPPVGLPQFMGDMRAEGDILRLVVRGDIAEGLRRARPATAQFGLAVCAPVTGGLCGWPSIPIEYR